MGGHLLKDRVGRVGEFVDALHRVAAGGAVMDPEAAARLSARRTVIRWSRSPGASAKCRR